MTPNDTAMKCISIFLVLNITVAWVKAEIPDYLHTCKRNDPEVSKCIENSILSLRDKLKEGIPEIGVVKIDPIYMEKLDLNLGPGISATGTNLLLTGGSNYEINNFQANLDAETYSFDLIIPGAKARGNYELEASIASIPLKGKGPISISAESVFGRGTLHGKKLTRNGKIRYYYPSMDLKLEVTDVEIKLEHLFEGAPEIGEIMNKLLNEEKDELLTSVIPAIEKVLINQILDSANKIVKPYTWDELFPEF